MNGVIVNVVAVLAGTFVGFLFGGLIPERMRSTASSGSGLATSVTGAMMARGGRRDLAGSHLGDYAPLVLVGSPSRLSSSEVVKPEVRLSPYIRLIGAMIPPKRVAAASQAISVFFRLARCASDEVVQPLLPKKNSDRPRKAPM